MADEDLTPQPFERRRNLSNRNFEKYGSRRRPSTASSNSSSFDSPSLHQESHDSSAATDSSSLQISYSVNSDTENGFREKSLRKLRLPTSNAVDRASVGTEQTPPQTPDPALLDVKQKVIRFEGLKPTNNFLFRFSRQQKVKSIEEQPKYPVPSYVSSTFREFSHDEEEGAEESSSGHPSLSSARNSSSMFNVSIDEESTAQTEDDVDNFSDYEEEDGETAEVAEEALDATSIGDIGEADSSKVGRSISVEATNSVAIAAAAAGADRHSNDIPQIIIMDGSKTVGRDFKRNYSLKPRPKTQIIATTNSRLAGKFRSHYEEQDADDYEEAELRHKCDINVNNILEELLKTEEKYVHELLNGIENYGTIFERKDLPLGLRGKKYDLFGNIEQIAEFHRDEFLPMLHRNRRDLKRLFDEFQAFIDQNCFYGYVIFTMNKQTSLKLCDAYRPYFKLIQSELNDKLGINSFLVQPIQRMARYPLLLLEFIKKMFNNQEMKPILDSCCRLEKKVRTLLTTTNESEIINDIVNCHEFNVRLQGRFRKVDTFKVYDYTLKRAYNAKVFIFDKCIIYTEIKGKSLLFHGRYPCEHVGITSKHKSFTLYYERRKQQECDFSGEPALVEHWLELIKDMINSFVREEREKLQERYTRDNDHLHRKPPSLSLYRDSNRFSSDSGIGNIWVMPKPENDEFVANRTTWYAVT